VVKVLSKSGDSLADTYDVEGSIAGIEQLRPEEITLVHEMGATLFSERMSGAIRRARVEAINQSTVFDVVLTDLPAGNWRVFAVVVFANFVDRVGNVMVAMRDPGSGREIPIFLWDTANDAQSTARIVQEGAAAGNVQMLIPNPLQTPSFGVGSGQPQQVPEIAMRGTSSAFGAGTVAVTTLIYLGLSQIGGLSSRGLPVPSW